MYSMKYVYSFGALLKIIFNSIIKLVVFFLNNVKKLLKYSKGICISTGVNILACCPVRERLSI